MPTKRSPKLGTDRRLAQIERVVLQMAIRIIRLESGTQALREGESMQIDEFEKLLIRLERLEKRVRGKK